MSETEEWKPTKIRPQSTMAQAFSSALDSAFSLDSDVDHLSQTIDQKKHQMMIQSRELEVLQRRIREAEERLKREQNETQTNGGEEPSAAPTDSADHEQHRGQLSEVQEAAENEA